MGINDYPLVMTNSLLLNIAIEIVNFPSYKMVIFHSYVSLPEGIYLSIYLSIISINIIIRYISIKYPYRVFRHSYVNVGSEKTMIYKPHAN